VISNFNDLHVGDLAFLAMAIGMNNSAGAHCVHCIKKASDFNTAEIFPHEVRTKPSLTTSLNEFNRRRLTTKTDRNWNGVNCVGLLDIDPQRIIIPTLHCPMGLVDKVLVSFKGWTIHNVENLPEASHLTRQTYITAANAHADAKATEAQATLLNQQPHRTPASIAGLKLAKDARALARTANTQAKKNFDEMVKCHNSRLFSLSQSFDCTFRSHGIKKEHYHGGKYNGVNCIRIMEKSQLLFAEFATSIKNNKIPGTDDALIDTKMNEHAKLLGLLDAIWSNVRGTDAGLLPTEAQINCLRKATAEGKALWNAIDIGTLQPKWHMTFDGHLVDQVIKHGGLADKADDTIEFQHQMLMRLRDRYRSVTSYQRKETCIRKELRRRKSPEIQSHIDNYEASKRRMPTRITSQAAAQRQVDEREAKRVKRETFVNGQCIERRAAKRHCQWCLSNRKNDLNLATVSIDERMCYFLKCADVMCRKSSAKFLVPAPTLACVDR